MERRRHCVAAAIALVCAVTALAAPGTAFAAPAAPAAPMVPAALTAPAEPVPPGPPGGARPQQTLEQIRLEIEGLYHQAVSATDAYNLAEDQVQRQSTEIVELGQEAAKAQDRIDDLKQRAGATARAQYRGGGLPPEAQLLLTNDPQLFLDGANRFRQGQKATKDLLREMEQTQQELDSYARDASTQWRKLEENRLKQAKARKEIAAKISAAEKIEARLKKEEKERLLVLEREAAQRAQASWLASGALKVARGAEGAATEQGKKAVAFATAQLGKPYEWGAEGPGSYDCSGLTSKAWEAAGITVPRTSQEQWRQLPKVDIKDMRPGDLIIYHADASHVGMYVGDGAIVHSPRPGRTVTITGAGANKILGVVRPGG
ncbi:NlpC/P60 family protein [Streptomyces sp. NPDC020412]|uniref:C40 family peptidase n=1 Tax=Streptomyces sp. NPDC020412 TaxID=3365073 RepID=UPI00378AC661